MICEPRYHIAPKPKNGHSKKNHQHGILQKSLASVSCCSSMASFYPLWVRAKVASQIRRRGHWIQFHPVTLYQTKRPSRKIGAADFSPVTPDCARMPPPIWPSRCILRLRTIFLPTRKVPTWERESWRRNEEGKPPHRGHVDSV